MLNVCLICVCVCVCILLWRNTISIYFFFKFSLQPPPLKNFLTRTWTCNISKKCFIKLRERERERERERGRILPSLPLSDTDKFFCISIFIWYKFLCLVKKFRCDAEIKLRIERFSSTSVYKYYIYFNGIYI